MLTIGERRNNRASEVLDKLAIMAARLHLEGGLAPDQIVDRLVKSGADIRGQRDIRRLISRAREQGLVSIEVKNLAPECLGETIDRSLGDRLAAVTGIRDVSVVTCAARAARLKAWPDHASSEHRHLRTEEVSGHLGHVAANYLWEHIRHYDTIAIAGGHTTASMVDSLGRLRERFPKSFEGLRILSLLGGMERTRLVPYRHGSSNAQAIELGNILGVPGDSIHLVQLPTFLDEEQHGFVGSLAPHIEDGWRAPDIAVFGLMVADVNPKYQYIWANARVAERYPEMRPVLEDVKVLSDSLTEQKKPVLMKICSDHFWIGNSDGKAGPSKAVIDAMRSELAKVES